MLPATPVAGRTVRAVKRWIGAVAVLAASCGGSSGPTYATPHDIADRLDCGQTYNAEAGAIAPADVATCRFDNTQITLVVGKSDALRDATVTMAAQLAGKFGVKGSLYVVQGPRWAVMGDVLRSTAVDIQAKTGGTIKAVSG